LEWVCFVVVSVVFAGVMMMVVVVWWLSKSKDRQVKFSGTVPGGGMASHWATRRIVGVRCHTVSRRHFDFFWIWWEHLGRREDKGSG